MQPARAGGGATVFFDRSPACTLALSRDLGFELAEVPAGPLADRVALMLKTVSRHRQAG